MSTTRGIAYIGKIISINPIIGADKIESVEVVCGEGGRWKGTTQKGLFQIGSLCEVYLQDALLPEDPRFDFMKPNKYIVKMRKFLGVPSEVLIMELLGDPTKQIVGTRIDHIMGVRKYEKPVPACISGIAKGNFPSFMPKTDEPNLQRVQELVDALKGDKYYSTVKIDGSSGTVYIYNNLFGVCSRNLELKDTDNNAFWWIAKKYDLENKLKELNRGNIALQFEIYGPGIQGNSYGAKEIDAALFNVFDIDNRCYLNAMQLLEISQKLDFPMAPIIDWNVIFPNTITDDELRMMAEGIYPNRKQREGVVIRSMEEKIINGQRLSFKVINLNYKGK